MIRPLFGISLRLFLTALVIGILFSGQGFSQEEDLRELVRGGCPDERSCCLFGKWKLISDADVYDTDDAITKIAHVKKGQEMDTVSGRVHSSPGKLKMLFDHGDWTKGQTIGIYDTPKKDRKLRYGTAIKTQIEVIPFLDSGEKCSPASEKCWGRLLTQPKTKWMIQVQLPGKEKKEGWIDAKHFKTEDGC